MSHTVAIVHTITGEVVKEFDVTGDSPRRVERLIDGISINLNHGEYHVEDRADTRQEA